MALMTRVNYRSFTYVVVKMGFARDVKTIVYALAVILCASASSHDEGGCGIPAIGSEGAEYENFQLAGKTLTGIYTYSLLCTGTVTSVRATGFCPAATNGSGVVMHITVRDGQFSFDSTLVPAECNTSAPVGPDYYEGYVDVNNLTIRVFTDGFLGVRFESECTADSCLFQPAITNKTSSQRVLFLNNSAMVTEPKVSILFSGEILTEDNEDSGQGGARNEDIIAAVTAFLLLHAILVTSILVTWRVVRKRQARKKSSLLPADYYTPISSIHPVAVHESTELTSSTTNDDYRLKPVAYQADTNGPTSIEDTQKDDESLLQHSYEYSESSPLRDTVLAVSHELFDYEVPDSETAYWEPASVEDEVRAQLLDSGVQHIAGSSIRLFDGLGSGEFGVVRRGVWSVGGEEREVAVKSLVDGSTEEKRIQFLREAAIMGQFKHPNVITLHGVLLERDPLMLVVELMANGCLRNYLPLIRTRFTGDALEKCKEGGTLLSFCRQVATGMTYLAGRGFVHRDLAARNILVSKEDHCKIADFGMSRALQDTDYYVSRGGKIPVKWTAPEALHYKKYSTASDVWSFGMVMYEIWSLGMKPFHKLTNLAFNEISAGHTLPSPPGCPRKMYNLMLKCWRLDPHSRPPFSQILPEFQDPDFKTLTWTAEDVAAYTEEARTLGAPLEAGEELFRDLRQF